MADLVKLCAEQSKMLAEKSFIMKSAVTLGLLINRLLVTLNTKSVDKFLNLSLHLNKINN